ncbi:hypothetical protein [Spongiimicrobium sp. 3-5]|uniref:hypothetical protein n=1 Tax=Spongiimicrobium sp. 3-5 TaxID=3332596 RepID=UPI0039818393
MIRRYIHVLFLLIPFLGIWGQVSDSLVLPQDNTSVLEQRLLNEDLQQKYSGEEFNYDIKDGEAQNLIVRFLNWFFGTLQEKFGINIDPRIFTVLEYLIYALMGALAIYLLVKFLIGENLSSVFTKKSTSLTDINLSEEHIENVDLDALIKDALKQKDFRLAIRYQFLRILKTLSQKSLIDWHFEKTNLDYQNEISAPQIKDHFKEVSYLYDYIWYGEQYIDENGYKAAKHKFVALRNTLE